MTYHYDARGERIEDDELGPDDIRTKGMFGDPDRAQARSRREPYRMPLDPEVVARCNELRRILREARARRQAVA